MEPSQRRGNEDSAASVERMTSRQDVVDLLDRWVLADKRVVTYRLLSRTQQCHVDEAREALITWRTKSGKSCHSTFVVIGEALGPDADQQIEDVEVSVGRSAAPGSSPLRQAVKLTKLLLVAEEDLEAVKAQLKVQRCHIYSVEPARLKDDAPLVGVAQEIRDLMRAEPRTNEYMARTYGTIGHKQVQALEADPTKRRTRSLPVVPILRQASTAKTVDHASQTLEPASKIVPGVSPAATPALLKSISSSTSVSSAKPRAPSREASALATAFSKTVKPRTHPARSEVKKEIIIKPEPMARSVSRDAQAAESANLGSETRQRQNAALAAMMTDDVGDDEMTEEPDAEDKEGFGLGDTMAEANAAVVADVEDQEMLSDWSASEDGKNKPIDSAPVATSRPRGKKRVKKQTHSMDAKGYIQTKDEWVWVSCSEDEESAAPAKPAAASSSRKQPAITTAVAAPLDKPKIGSGKASIASFFKKKT